MKATKVYPWKGRIRGISGKYGIFPEIESNIHWDIQDVYSDPFELGKKFGSFAREKHDKTVLKPVHVLPKSGKQGPVINFLKTRKIEPLTEEEFEAFKKGLEEGYKG